MEAYKLDLQRFRQKTPLALFCQCQKRRRRKPSKDFKEVVAEFDWPHEVTLEVVEQFRQEFAYHYKLRDCAMLLAKVLPGSFIITWFIPESIVKKLREDIPHLILKKYTVVSLQIAGVKVYPPPQKSAAVSPPGPGPSAAGAAASDEKSLLKPKAKKPRLSPEEDYPFVEKPSEDFFCPVTLGLLLQPHLTSCCGKHLSEESATRIQGEGGPCPLCKAPDWSTVLNKLFRRQVKELHVFCRHKEKGCWWKGELSDFTQHVHSCQFRYLQVSTQVCTTGGVATFTTKPVSVFFLSTLLSPYLSLSTIVSLPLPRKEQSSTMLLREEMWRQLRDSSPLLSISTPGLRM
ncbi:hypothetical protein GBAR_LOCUS10554 [Geodia barretti]|uniref:Uncharacterized protein n=1 Tax=Geodia barretti TaxID=519541 RepID=A0AA35RV08_GEOBA|nr:hypothetical protein GBAR_LOCUS10554 [Geodia barretti]